MCEWAKWLLCACLYFLCDVEVTGVNAVCEQILGAAALTRPEHAVVGLEQLTAGRKPEALLLHHYPLNKMMVYRMCQLRKLLLS